MTNARTTRPAPHAWVDAAPFRAHLLHLSDTTGLPWHVVALAAGLTVNLATSLVDGRHGRPLRRLPHPDALRLLALTPTNLLELVRQPVEARPTCRRLKALTRRGCDAVALAARMGVPTDVTAALLASTPRRVAARWAFGVLAADALADREAIWMPGDSRAA